MCSERKLVQSGPKFDKITYTNNPVKLFDKIKKSLELSDEKQLVKNLIKIIISPDMLITIQGYKFNGEKFEEVAFEYNFFLDGNQKLTIVDEPRVVVILNFDRLPIKTKDSLRFDRCDAQPTGNTKIFSDLGFIRTKNDRLLGVVDVSKTDEPRPYEPSLYKYGHRYIYCP